MLHIKIYYEREMMPILSTGKCYRRSRNQYYYRLHLEGKLIFIAYKKESVCVMENTQYNSANIFPILSCLVWTYVLTP